MLWPEVPYRNSPHRLSTPWAMCPGIQGRRNYPCLAQDPRPLTVRRTQRPQILNE